jgi:hypothetical protein
MHRHPAARLTALSFAVSVVYGTMASADTLQNDLAPRAPSTTVLVNNCADNGAAGTLRDALNRAIDDEEIDLNCSLITLAMGQLKNQANNLVIAGGFATPTIISGDDKSRVLFSSVDGNYTKPINIFLKNLDIRNGKSVGIGSNTEKPADPGFLLNHGGCIRAIGNVTLYNSVMSHCSVTGKDDSTMANVDAAGGAIFAAGIVRLFGSKISFSSTYSQNGNAYGGAIFASGRATMYPALDAQKQSHYTNYTNSYVLGTGSTISYSTALSGSGNGFGGGVHANGVFRSRFSTISGCQGTNVGGISANSEVLLIGSTVSHNSAKIGVGGISAPDFVASNSTIAFNMGSIGGLQFRGNANSDFTVKDSIFSNSTKYIGPGSDPVPFIDIGATSAVTISGSGNLIQTFGQGITVPSDTIANIDPLLDSALSNNGGTTATHALRSGSPALGVVFLSDVLDQRGIARPTNKHSDIGSIEETIFKDGIDDLVNHP